MYDAGTAALTVTVSFRDVQKQIQKQAKLIAEELQRAIAEGLRDGYDKGGEKAPPAGTKAGAAYGQSFAQTVRKRIDAALKSLPEANVDADTSKADRRIQEIRKELAELSQKDIGVDIDEGAALSKLRALQKELTKIGHESPSVRVAMDTSTASEQLGKLRAEVDRLAVDHANIRPVVDDGEARTKLEGLRLVVDRLKTLDPTINVDADTGKAQASLLALSLRLGQVSRSATGIGLKAAGIGAIGVSAAGSALGVLRLAGALAPLAGLAIGMPAAIGGAVVALGSLKLALSGVGDVVKAGMSGDWKKYNDSIKQLAPNAQTAVGAIVALKGPLHDMQQAVQQTFFAGINKRIDDLGQRTLPRLRAALVSVSGGLNAMFHGLLTGLTGHNALAGLSAVATNLSTGLKRASVAVGRLVGAFGQIAQVGAPLLAQLGTGFANLSIRFAKFIDSATQSGQLAKWLDAAVSTLRTLGQLAGNVGSILITVIRTATATGGNLLSTITGLTGQLAAFLKSAQGTRVLQAIFGTIAGLADALNGALKAVLPALASGLGALAPSLVPLGNALGAIIRSVAPLLPIVGQLAAVVAGGLTQAFNAIRPALTVIVNALISGLRPILPLLTQAFAALAPVLGTIAGTLAGAFSAGIKVAVFLLQLFLPLITGILNFLATHQWVVKAIVIAIIAWTAAQWLLNVALDANPIGLIIIAIVALIAVVLLVIKYWGTISRSFQLLWHWILVGAKAVVAWFAGPFVGFFTALGAKVAGWFQPLVNFFTHTIPAAAGTLVGAVKGLWQGMLDRLVGIWNALKAYVLNPIGNFFTHTIPAAAGSLVGAVKGLWQGMLNRLVGIWHALQAYVLNPIGNFFTHTIPAAAGALVGAVKGLWQGMLNRLVGIWNALKTYVLNPIGSFFTHTIPAAAGALAGAVKGLWQGMYNRLLGIWTALKTTVLNPIGGFFVHTIPGWTGTLVGHVKALWGSMAGRLSGIWSGIKSAVIYPIRDFFTKSIPGWSGTLVGAVKKNFGNLASAVKSIWNRIKDFIKGPIKGALNMIGQLFTAVKSLAQKFKINAVATAAQGGYDAIKKAYGAVNGFAQGGYVMGPGGPRDDKVPAMLSAGEYVLPANVVSSIGVKNLEAMRKSGYRLGHAAGGLIQPLGMADGGPAKKALDWAIKNAKGKPYVWAAHGPNAFDCSGLVEAAYRHALGLHVGMDTYAQWRNAKHVSKSSLNYGDPVFENFDGERPPGHVGLYAGGNKIFDAATEGQPIGFDNIAGYFGAGKFVDKNSSGGILSFIGGLIENAIDWVKDIYNKYLKGPIDKLKGFNQGGILGQLLGGGGGVLGKLGGGIVDWVKGKFSDLLSMGGAPTVGGNLESWIRKAMGLTHAPSSWYADLYRIAMRESRGNPNAINNYDINAQNGIPSQGVMQVIPPVFKKYHQPGTSNNIKDPVANIAAAINYIRGRYGSIKNTPANYYDKGGILPPGATLALNHTGGNEYVFTPAQLAAMRSGSGSERVRQIIIQPREATLDYGRLNAMLDRQNQLDRMVGRPT